MLSTPLEDLRSWFGLGVAGNFAGHLEQAGEAGDFTSVEAESAEAPKGIFPWYVPGHDSFLGTFPLACDHVALPAGEALPNLQIEPEVGVACRVRYDSGRVSALEPFALGAFNDCSIRREGAAKISHKKNWGAGSKGIAPVLFEISDLSPDGPTAPLRLACFLRRPDGTLHAYGADSPLSGYSYYGDQLLDWIAERLANQHGAPGTPLEDAGALMAGAGQPEHALIGIGATRYTDVGASTYLQPGDESIVAVYDAERTAPEALPGLLADGTDVPAASVLRQPVRAP